MPDPSFYLREFFHLNFLRHLSNRLSGRVYAVKGGICLRFFHRSPRLSDDMDMDILSQVRGDTLKNAVDSVLESKPFLAALVSQNIVHIESKGSKQTETTQRWKIGIRLSDGNSLQSKVEFSRRAQSIDYASGIPDAKILNQYGMSPFAAQFYGSIGMTAQKIRALAAESRNAARDLFDLHHLFSFCAVKPVDVANLVTTQELERAAQKVGSFTYQDFKKQVVGYLTDDLQSLYNDSQAFEKLKGEVETALIRRQ